MDGIADQLFNYYGLDWGAMLIGLLGTYLIMHKKRVGFLCSGTACALGLAVASMSEQTGYIVYNAILIGMMIQAFRTWNTPLPAKVDAE